MWLKTHTPVRTRMERWTYITTSLLTAKVCIEFSPRANLFIRWKLWDSRFGLNTKGYVSITMFSELIWPSLLGFSQSAPYQTLNSLKQHKWILEWAKQQRLFFLKILTVLYHSPWFPNIHLGTIIMPHHNYLITVWLPQHIISTNMCKAEQ